MDESLAFYTRLSLSDMSPERAQTADRLLDELRRSRGKDLNIFRLLSIHPDLLTRFSDLGTMLGNGILPPRLRELTILRTAACCECEYEQHQHVPRALRAGLTADEAVVASDPARRQWGEPELTVLDAATELCATRMLSLATWSRLSSYLDDAELVEFVCLVAFYVCVAHVVGGLDIPLESGE